MLRGLLDFIHPLLLRHCIASLLPNIFSERLFFFSPLPRKMVTMFIFIAGTPSSSSSLFCLFVLILPTPPLFLLLPICYTHIHIHTCTFILYTYIHTCIHTYIYTYIHIYIYTYAPQVSISLPFHHPFFPPPTMIAVT